MALLTMDDERTTEPDIEISDCPVCEKKPEWVTWKIADVTLWAIRCAKSPTHYYHTSYWTDPEQTAFEWERLCEDVQRELMEGGQECEERSLQYPPSSSYWRY
jgi:hypothetical protein